MRPRCSAGEIEQKRRRLKTSMSRNEAPVFCRGNLEDPAIFFKKQASRNEAPVFCRGNPRVFPGRIKNLRRRNEAPVFCRGNFKIPQKIESIYEVAMRPRCSAGEIAGGGGPESRAKPSQ